MRAALVVICFLLTIALIQNASAKGFSRSIWTSIRSNADDIKTNKENVDNMKQDFASQTMLMTQMNTTINDMT